MHFVAEELTVQKYYKSILVEIYIHIHASKCMNMLKFQLNCREIVPVAKKNLQQNRKMAEHFSCTVVNLIHDEVCKPTLKAPLSTVSNATLLCYQSNRVFTNFLVSL